MTPFNTKEQATLLLALCKSYQLHATIFRECSLFRDVVQSFGKIRYLVFIQVRVGGRGSGGTFGKIKIQDPKTQCIWACGRDHQKASITFTFRVIFFT